MSLALSLRTTGDIPQAQTKMTADITQDKASFRGIEQVYVIPFQTESAIPVSMGNTRLGNRNVYINNPVISQTGLVPNNHSHLYNFVVVPLSTNRVLAYGKAFDSGEVLTKEGRHKNGVLKPSGLDDPETSSDISFSLQAILETSDIEEINDKADQLIAALNGVVEVLQAFEEVEILAFLDVFATENEIFACSYPTVYYMQKSILGAVSQYSGTNPDAINALMPKLSQLESALSEVGSKFPVSYGVPEGTVGMWWNGHRFVRLIENVNVSLVPVSQYCYPPSLWYYSNSAIKTSADESYRNQYDPNNSTWDKILAHYTHGTSVTSDTRAVAIMDQMQYGDALVEFCFLEPGENAAAAVNCPLKGIVIGDQKDVDFSFSPQATSTAWFVYDNKISSGVTLGGETSVQTLVLPTASNQTVHFAFEFENNTSSAFRCQQGFIQPGSRFYLAGELKPDGGTQPAQENIPGVFYSDHKTTVKIRVASLEKAYNTVPDLRDPQLEIGVSVEMDWRQVEPGGIKLQF